MMTSPGFRRFWRGVVACAISLASVTAPDVHAAQRQQLPPPAAQVTPDPWPRTVDLKGTKYSLYQPQLDSWDGRRIEAHAVVSVVAAGGTMPVFGVVEITAQTDVDRASRTMSFREIKVQKSTFPSTPQQAETYGHAIQTIASTGRTTISLDRVEAMLAIEGAEKKAQRVPVKNDPPAIVFSQRSAILVPIDGEPVWRPVGGTGLERVLNTRAFVVRDGPAGTLYIHVFDGFVQATGLSGPWTVAPSVPASVSTAAATLAKDGAVDLMEGPRDGKNPKAAPSLAKSAPDVIVATTPTELIVVAGAPDWVPIESSALVYVKNTTGNVFLYLNDQRTYVLVTGRWFRGKYLAGPWEHVAAAELPPDFARIPDDSPKENVKASVPGTPQAQEAVIANEIPQMATIDRAQAQFTPAIDGPPDLRPVPDTGLTYVFNSPAPIIQVSPTAWYAAQNGVWFTAVSVAGPWAVATSIPPAIYSIPPSSPLHYVTYVRVYDVTPQYVVVGYTPGYYGTVVTPAGVVVYGTGYTYVPYIGATVWYPPPVTYGYAAAVAWTPWTGWAVGFGFGLAFGAAVNWSSHCCWGYCPAPYWGAMPYTRYYGGAAYGWHGSAAVWGPGGWAATSGNVYQRWGSTGVVTRTSGGYNAWTGNAWSSQVGHSYNSVTGRISAGQRGAVQNVYTGNYAYGQRGATYNPTTGVSARGGSATVGNAYTGQQGSARWGQVTGPGGQSASAARVGNNYYATHDGNVYRNTGSGWQHYDSGGWNSVQRPTQVPALQSQAQARWTGDSRSAGAAWGSSSWGGGFAQSGAGGYGGGGWDRAGSGGAGGWNRGGWSGGGGGGWDAGAASGGGGGWSGGGRSWGGASFGGRRR